MELIYVWLEDLHPFEKHTSINLSSQFNVTCKVDEEAKTIQLDIEENADSISDFFGREISNVSNVTALIGRNGTGKSIFCEFLTELLTKCSSTDPLKSKCFAFFYDSINKAFNVKESLCDWKENSVALKQITNSNTWKIELKKPLIINKIDRIEDALPVFYSPIVDLRNFPVKVDTKPFPDVSTDFLLIHDNHKDEQENPIENHRYKNVVRQIEFIKQFKENKNIKNRFPLPNELTLKSLNPINDVHWNNNLSSGEKEIRAFFIGYQWEGMEGCIREERTSNPDNQNKLREIKLNFLWYFVGHFFKSLNREYYEYRPIGVTLEEIKGKNAWKSFRNFLEKQSWTTDNGKAAISLLDEMNKVFKAKTVTEYDDKNNSAIQLLNSDLILPILKAHNDYKKSLPIYKGKIYVPDLIQVDWRNLSSGEKAFLDIFSRLFYATKQINERDKGKSIKWLYLLLDEGDLYFHPEWQRQYLNIILSVVPEIFEGIKLQIILTSHSPFVISDLPKDNVVFLKREKNELTTVDNKPIDIQNTFAENIHTLLKSGFFLEEGIMGAFAKKKIKEALKQIEHKDLKHKLEIEKLIAIIGEPIIRQKMRQLFEEKYGIESKEDKIIRLEKELEEVKNKLNQ